jgi:hypothetical protein
VAVVRLAFGEVRVGQGGAGEANAAEVNSSYVALFTPDARLQ